LLQPFNKSYIPNFKNTWPEYRDPWYDQQAQYSAPYTVYTTGIGYRTDRGVDPTEGYKMLWNPDYIDHAGLLDDSGESLGMAMLAWDITTDINTGNLEYINAARDKLIELIDLVHIKTGVSAYAKIPNGDFTVSQCWSGDMIAGSSPYYLNKGDTAAVLGYWAPQSSADLVIGNDCICIPKSASKPVLGHMFINDLLDNDISYQNFDWNGYQPPLTKLNADYLINVKKRIPDNLVSSVVVPKDFEEGYTFYEVSPEVQNEWLAAYQEFEAGG
jgi:spermidine/putrescine transport system substrate-binding protein